MVQASYRPHLLGGVLVKSRSLNDSVTGQQLLSPGRASTDDGDTCIVPELVAAEEGNSQVCTLTVTRSDSDRVRRGTTRRVYSPAGRPVM